MAWIAIAFVCVTVLAALVRTWVRLLRIDGPFDADGQRLRR